MELSIVLGLGGAIFITSVSILILVAYGHLSIERECTKIRMDIVEIDYECLLIREEMKKILEERRELIRERTGG